MKKLMYLFCFVCFMATSLNVSAIVGPASTNTATEEEKLKEAEVKDYWKGLSKKERRAKKKEMKKALKKAKADGADANMALLVILAILLPPLSMYLYEGVTNRFWISLLLTILFFLPGIIYTLIVILS